MRRLNAEQRSKVLETVEPVDNVEQYTERTIRTHAGGVTRVEQWDGKDWLVVETVAVISKVLNGELLPAESLAIAEAWNGRAVPIRHPKANGLFVSANSPAILSEFNVGYFFNARTEPHPLGAKLAGEMWIDLERAQSIPDAAGVVERLNNGDTIEVSTAYFCMIRDETGTYNGEAYNGVQFDIKPDHVAILPDQEGACSIADGCGVGRTNSEEGEDAEPVANLDGAASAMVAVHLSPATAAAFAGGDGFTPEDAAKYHVTLAYLGVGPDVGITFEEAAAAVDWVASQFYSFTARLSGEFRFYADAGPDAVGFLIEGEMLTKIHRALRNEFEWSGQPVKTHGSYIPHLTMGYTSGDSVTLPSPGVDRFAVTEISLTYGDETIRFPLRGMLGTAFQSRQQSAKEDEDMSDKNLKTNCVKANEDGDGAQVPTEPKPETVAVPSETLAKIAGFMERVDAMGGLDAVADAMDRLAKNDAAERASAIATINAAAPDVYGSDELGEMSTDQLAKLAKVLGTRKPAANYGAQNAATPKPDAPKTVDGIPAGFRAYKAAQ